MKGLNKLCIALISFVAIISMLNPTNVIKTESKKYASANDTNTVSTRELAMLASIVYEDVPNDNRYDGITDEKGCSINEKNGTVASGCYFTVNDSKMLRLRGSIFDVKHYIEGLSERKLYSLVSGITSAFKEDGPKYYFLNFADTNEEMKKWEIVHYGSKEMAKSLWLTNIDDHLDGVFDAITFKKGNNYVIAYRGTDYPDFLEWLQDVFYVHKGQHWQAVSAYKYAQSEYERILSENEGNEDAFNIYVTGHSLGAYLAQVGGAAIIEKANGQTNPYRKPDEINDLDDFQNWNPAKSLKQVAYFNGMGVGGFYSSNAFIRNIDNALLYLSTYVPNPDYNETPVDDSQKKQNQGKLADTGRYVNYSKNITQSSGRLVLYSMEGDPISEVGLHYGEIYKLDVGADAIKNHHQTHDNLFGKVIGQIGESMFLSMADSEKIQNFLAELDKIKGAKAEYIGALSETLYNLIDFNTQIFKSYSTIPTYVKRTMALENEGKDVTAYGFGTFITNLSNIVKKFHDKYGDEFDIINLFDHFNMNHETDSFVCLIDKENGAIKEEKIGLEVSTNNINCVQEEVVLNDKKESKTVCYTNNYETLNYKLGSEVHGTGKNIILTATVNNGCAKKYNWYYSTDNKNFTLIGTTVRNEIVIPQKTFMTNKEGTQTLYFKVKINYGDNYQERKASLGNNELIEYYIEKESDVNPTINDGISSTVGIADSASKELTFVYDTTAPNCTFNLTSKTLNIRYTFFGLWPLKTYDTVKMTCEDKLSGMDVYSANTSEILMDANTAFLGLPLVEIDGKVTVKKLETNNMRVTVPIVGKRVPSNSKNHAVLYYEGGFKDKAGNKAPKKSMNIYTKKG